MTSERGGNHGPEDRQDEGPNREAQAEKESSPNQLDNYLNALSKRELAVQESIYGFLPESDPVYQEVNRVATKIFGEESNFKIEIAMGNNIVNAFALPDGHIILFPGVLKLTQTEDELAALLAHEGEHIRAGHSARMIETKPVGQLINRIESRIGMARMHEYEADLASIVTFLEQAGFNPLAGASLFERMQTVGDSWSLDHGSLEDRRLNILSLKHFLDLENISQETKPFSPEFAEAVESISKPNQETFRQKLDALQKLERPAIKAVTESLRSGDRQAVLLAFEALASLSERAKSLALSARTASSEVTKGTTIKTGTKTSVLHSRGMLEYQRSCDEIFRSFATNPNLPANLSETGVYAMLDVGAGLNLLKNAPTFDIRSDDGDFVSLQVFDEAAEGNVENVLSALDPDLWRQESFLPLFEPENFQPRLESYLLKLDEAGAIFVSEETGEFNQQLFLEKLGEITNKAEELLTSLGYERVFRKSDFVATLIDGVASSNEISTAELLEAAEKAGLDLPESLKKADKANVGVGLAEILYRVGSVIPQEEEDRHLKTKEVERAEDDFIEYAQANPGNFLTELKEICSHMLGSEASFTYANTVGIFEDRFSIEDDSQYQSFYLDLLKDAAEFGVEGNYWEETCDFVIRALIPEGGSRTFITADREGALYSALEDISREHLGADGSWIERLETWSIVFDALMLSVGDPNVDSDYAWDILERWHRLTNFSGLPRETDYDEANPELSQKVVADLWHPDLKAERKMIMADMLMDSDIRRRVKAFAAEELIQHATYQELVEMLFVDKVISPADSPELVRYLIEDLARSPEQIEQVQRYIAESYRESARDVGVMTGAEAFLEHTLSNPQDYLTSMLETRDDESQLIELIFEQWFEVVEKAQQNKLEPQSLTYIDSPEQVINWINERPDDSPGGSEESSRLRQRINDLTERLYRSNIVERHGLTRKLLTVESTGVLNSNLDTLAVVNELTERHIELNPNHRHTVEEVIDAFVRSADKDELYFLLAPIMSQAILQRPSQNADYRSIVKEHIRQFYEEGDNDNYLDGELSAKVDGYETLGDCLSEKVYRWAFRASGEDSNVFNYADLAVLQSLPERYREGVIFEKMEEADAMLEVATTLGAPGVRFLQLLGQYIKISPEMEKRFSVVYDSIEGQSKLSAHRTIQRERPDILDSSSQISPRIGGGSLLTVYRYDSDQVDKPQVVKVLNPNAEQRVKESMSLARKTADHLVRKAPSNKHYALVRDHLLSDLEEWLYSDIADDSFVENDKKFYEKWNGFRVEGSGYEIVVPKVEEKSTRHVKIEEYVEGKNLTQFTVEKESDYEKGTLSQQDMKEAVRLIASHYIYQVLDGMVHSDVHPGNFRITPDKKIAVLDRNYYLELTDDDRQLFSGLASNPAEALADYLLKQKENQQSNISSAEVATIFGEQLTSTAFTENPEAVFEVVARVKEAGLRVPLRITLLLKNLNALNNLASSAGFSSALEALS